MGKMDTTVSLFPISLLTIIFASSVFVYVVMQRGNNSSSKSKSKSKMKMKQPPGPFSVPVFGNWLQVGNDLNHRYLAQLSLTHGPLFLLKLGSRKLVVVSDPKLATQVLHTQGVQFGSRPRNLVFDIFTGNGQDMVFTVYGEHWRKMRRIMTLPFFTSRVVNQYSSMWEQEMGSVLDDISSSSSSSSSRPAAGICIVIRKRLQLMLYNIIYGMMFDERFESVSDPLFLQATRFNSERSRLAQSFDYNYGDFLPILTPFLRGYLNKCRDLQAKRLAFFNNHYVEKRRQVMMTTNSREDQDDDDEANKQLKEEPAQLMCAMDYILEAERKGEISSENVLYIVENINVAAIETTLWSMEWAIAELVNHPKVQNKLRQEIFDVLGTEEEEELPAGVTEANLPRLPYLQAVVKEALRLHTPIPLLVPHMNLEEAELGGYGIPKESKVVVNAWWLANNPAWWDKPEEFRPERFLEEEAGVEACVGGKDVDFRFLPFGAGRRSCPGIILAVPILCLVVGKLVSKFEMRPPPGWDKIDVTEKGGQFSLHMAHHALVAFHPINMQQLDRSSN